MRDVAMAAPHQMLHRFNSSLVIVGYDRVTIDAIGHAIDADQGIAATRDVTQQRSVGRVAGRNADNAGSLFSQATQLACFHITLAARVAEEDLLPFAKASADAAHQFDF